MDYMCCGLPIAALLVTIAVLLLAKYLREAESKRQRDIAERQRQENNVRQREIDKRNREIEEQQWQAAWEFAQKTLALTCRRCQALAPPIPDTGNRYRCPSCGNQFAGARHSQ